MVAWLQVVMSYPSSVRFLRDYVAIPSVNPMRRSDIPPELVGERRYASHVLEQLRRMRVDAELVGSGERASVIAHATARGARETVMIASHLDTVPVDGMEIDPFDPRIENGRLYGRGSCDTKSGMAAAVAALEHVLERGKLRRNVVLVGEADEECASVGVRDVLASLGKQKPDWVIATEPTDLEIVTAHKGIALVRLVAHGVSCHSSEPRAGRNAIVALARAVLALEALGEEIGQMEHPRLGRATLSVGLIGGGQAANIVPQEAWLVTDRRLLPGEDEQRVRTQIESALERRGVADVEIASCAVEKPALETDDDAPAVRACQAALASLGLPTETTTAAFSTDAGLFAEAGLPGVVFGPGSIAQAHTAREWVALDQVERATAFFTNLLQTEGS
ncbi:MAG TPA: M20/M25/M40 family metallo-hydrolase [Candidatus Binatia bacterium]